MRAWLSSTAFAINVLTVSTAQGQTPFDAPPPRLMTQEKWASLTTKQKDIYIIGFLETVSFSMYGRSRQDDERQAQIFSTWTVCAESRPVQFWQPIGPLPGEGDRTLATELFHASLKACKDSVGKADVKWRPVWLLKTAEWKSLSPGDRAIYLMAYTETSFEMARISKDTHRQHRLTRCIASAGIEAFLASMEQITIWWDAPLPWSVSRALGKTCSIL